MNYSEGQEEKRDQNMSAEVENETEAPYVMTLKKSAVITMAYFHVAAAYGLYMMCTDSTAANNWFGK